MLSVLGCGRQEPAVPPAFVCDNLGEREGGAARGLFCELVRATESVFRSVIKDTPRVPELLNLVYPGGG